MAIERNLTYSDQFERARLDFVSVEKDSPTLILLHGGGFTSGSKRSSLTRYLARKAARAGNNVASIDYPLLSEDKPKVNDFMRILDIDCRALNAAVAFLHESGRIENSQIYLMGFSAGASIAVEAAYNSEFSQRYIEDRFNLTGVISVAGSVIQLPQFSGPEEVPLMLVHGAKDAAIDINSGLYKKRNEFPVIYGSRAMYEAAASKDAPVKFYEVKRKGHQLHKKRGSNSALDYQFLNSLVDEMREFQAEIEERNIRSFHKTV